MYKARCEVQRRRCRRVRGGGGRHFDIADAREIETSFICATPFDPGTLHCNLPLRAGCQCHKEQPCRALLSGGEIGGGLKEHVRHTHVCLCSLHCFRHRVRCRDVSWRVRVGRYRAYTCPCYSRLHFVRRASTQDFKYKKSKGSTISATRASAAEIRTVRVQ